VELIVKIGQLECIATDRKDKERKLHEAEEDLTSAEEQTVIVKDKLKLLCTTYGSNGPTPG
jgi:hypothetical protein